MLKFLALAHIHFVYSAYNIFSHYLCGWTQSIFGLKLIFWPFSKPFRPNRMYFILNCLIWTILSYVSVITSFIKHILSSLWACSRSLAPFCTLAENGFRPHGHFVVDSWYLRPLHTNFYRHCPLYSGLLYFWNIGLDINIVLQTHQKYFAFSWMQNPQTSVHSEGHAAWMIFLDLADKLFRHFILQRDSGSDGLLKSQCAV